MAHTNLFHQLRRSLSIARESALRGVDIEQVRDEQLARQLSRRKFLAQTAAAATGFSLIGASEAAVKRRRASLAGPAKVIVVGAGFAGLACAWKLKKAGVVAEIHEANSIVGGRVRTGRGYFSNGQTIELGAEFVDTGHTALRALAAEFGLIEDDILAAQPAGSEPTYWVDGARYTEHEITEDFKAMWPAMHQDVVDAGYPTLYNDYNARGRQLDLMNIDQWIAATVPGGLNSRLGRVLQQSYNTEYGAETTDQSALNLLYLLGYSNRTRLEMYGESDERYHIRGGNDQVATKVAAALPGQINYGSVLKAIVKRADGRYDLTFKQGTKTVVRTTEHVVLALPFSVLRSSVDFSRADFNPIKTTAINELGMGANVKLQLQFNTRLWNTLGYTGDSYSDRGYQSTFEATRAQTGTTGILCNYTSGLNALSMNQGTTAARATQFLSQVEPVFPGLSAKYNQKVQMFYWPGNPWSRGAYCYWKVGQCTKFAGAEAERSANVHFCGEHTSIDFQGFMNGAVETGNNAALEVLSDLGIKAK